MIVALDTAILSHLSDLQYDIYDNPEKAELRSKFVRSLIFHNKHDYIRVEDEYLDFMWNQAEQRLGDDCSYQEWQTNKEYYETKYPQKVAQ